MDNSSYQPIVLHLDDNNDVIQVTLEEVVRPITLHLGPFTSWDEIRDKPAAFIPENHQHAVADIDGLTDTLNTKLNDAPDDGKQYARQSKSWAEVDGLPDQTGHTGKTLTTDGTDASWQEQTGGSGDVEEAPQDGQLYFRHNSEWTAVGDTFLESTPVGLTALWDGSVTAPAGWLECNGSEITEADHPELFALYKDKVESGKAFLPDYRGEFIRGWDHGRGVDADRELGSEQADEIANHNHEVAIAINESKWDQMPFGTATEPTVMKGQYHDLGTGDTAEGNERWMLSNTRGGDETRPRNNAAMVIIKAIAGPNLVSQIAVPQRSVYSGIAGQQTFNHNYEINRPVSFYVNGLKLIKGNDFTADTGTSIRLNTPLVADADIEIESLGKLVMSGHTDVAELAGQVNTLNSSLTQTQTQVATQATDITQLQTDVSTVNTNLAQAQTDIGNIKTSVTNVETTLTTTSNDITQLQTETTTITASIAALTARVEALENQTTEPPVEEDDDMKLLETISLTGASEIVLETGFDNDLYGGYHLIINNLGTDDSGTYGEKKLGVAFKQSDDQWDTGFGSATTSVIKTGSYDDAMQDTYSGHVLVSGEMDVLYLSGTMTVSVNPSGKGTWTASLNSGNGAHYISAMLSAPVTSTVHGIKFYFDGMAPDKMIGNISLYGLKK